MDRHGFWSDWLLVVAVFVAAFGLVMAFFSGTAAFEPVNRYIDPAFWPRGELPGAAQSFQRWVYGAWGATVAGWGVFLACVARYPFRRGERWSWSCIAAGVSLWFVVDTGYSLYHEVYFNALAINTPLFILMLAPLIATRRIFFSR